jgi:phosphoglycolate phosphatase-like HAD superfamily hydrolase
MMIIFDVDGTLVGGEETDWQCFDDAFKEAAGFPLTSEFFHSLTEITAKAIVHQALDGAAHIEKREIETKTKQGYLDRLKKIIHDTPSAFPATEGAISLIQDIKRRGIPVAIATGDWQETSLLKLNASGIPIEGLPMTTSSDFCSRAQIISCSIKKARGNPDGSIYVGDGHWDFHATQKLGIEFIGCGTKTNRLRDVGVKYILDRLNVDEFWNTVEKIKLANNRRYHENK